MKKRFYGILNDGKISNLGLFKNDAIANKSNHSDKYMSIIDKKTLFEIHKYLVNSLNVNNSNLAKYAIDKTGVISFIGDSDNIDDLLSNTDAFKCFLDIKEVNNLYNDIDTIVNPEKHPNKVAGMKR